MLFARVALEVFVVVSCDWRDPADPGPAFSTETLLHSVCPQISRIHFPPGFVDANNQ